ncbi:hypothetical protein RD792_003802 [Penstemon davidsonii]|uniref:Uncharacterized protein n=1 Tax=Penstemon davidsonii TaxID=160366 RepID=A0ABR0DFR2_9LAMI|nr:hypothetical protein RD792_003802 [Penstemon davidsonii]
MSVATRGIEREIASLQMESYEKSHCYFQSLGEEAATKILARQLVRLRQQITNLQGSRAQIRGVATHTQALYANTSISTGMKGATKAMTAMNKQMAPAKQTKMIQEFQKQSAQMDMTIEMMSDAIDETLDKDEAEEETEELTNQVLDEIGVDIASQLSSAPKGRIASKKVENVAPRYEYYLAFWTTILSICSFVRKNGTKESSFLLLEVFVYYANDILLLCKISSSASTDVEDLEKRLASLRRI